MCCLKTQPFPFSFPFPFPPAHRRTLKKNCNNNKGTQCGANEEQSHAGLSKVLQRNQHQQQTSLVTITDAGGHVALGQLKLGATWGKNIALNPPPLMCPAHG